MANFQWASPGHFDAMGIPLRPGRTFRDDDDVEQPVVVSLSVAERLWPGLDPLGCRCLDGLFKYACARQPSRLALARLFHALPLAT